MFSASFKPGKICFSSPDVFILIGVLASKSLEGYPLSLLANLKFEGPSSLRTLSTSFPPSERIELENRGGGRGSHRFSPEISFAESTLMPETQA